MNYLISGGWGYGNWGDEAILLCTITLLNEYISDEDNITIMSYSMDNLIEYKSNYSCVYSLHGLIDREEISIENIVKWLQNKSIYLSEKEKNFISNFEKSETFIMCGGGYFNEEWEISFKVRLMEIYIAYRCGCKIFLHGQTIGPIQNKRNKEKIYKACKLVNKIFVRDVGSYVFLSKGVDEKKLEIIPDVVNAICDIRTYTKYEKEKYSVVMFCSYRYHRGEKYKYRGKKFAFIEQKMKTILALRWYYNLKVQKIIRVLSKKVKIIFLVSTDWDYEYALDVCNKSKENIEIKKNNSVDEYLSILSNANFIISTNMHPLVIGNAYGVPVIAISYGYKTDDFMRSIKLNKRLFNIDTFKASDVLKCLKNDLKHGRKVDKEIIYKSFKEIVDS